MVEPYVDKVLLLLRGGKSDNLKKYRELLVSLPLQSYMNKAYKRLKYLKIC